MKGLSDVKQACLDIENKINDSISPQPNYTLERQNHDQTIKLTIKSGLQKPYLYKSKAYKRNDTATIEVDTLEFSRLVLEGKNISFEELPCNDQELSFEILHRKLKENIRIEMFNQDTLKTLNLYDNVNGFNNAAGLLADKNHFSGITRIKQLYAESLMKPDFEVSENAIKIVLPVFEANVHLTEDEKVIYKFLSKTMLKPISEIAPYVPFGKSKTTHLLKTTVYPHLQL